MIHAASMKTRSAHRSLLIVGSVAFDDIDGPFGMHKDLLGGSASSSPAPRRTSPTTSRWSAVVGDDFPQHYLDEMTAAGIDATGIERKTGETFHWAGKYSDDLSSPRDARHPPRRVRDLPAQAGGAPQAKPRWCSSATSIRSCSATWSSRPRRRSWSRPTR
jgi:hypothetical protein